MLVGEVEESSSTSPTSIDVEHEEDGHRSGIGRERRRNRVRMAELGVADKCEEVITPDNSTEGNRKGKATAESISSEDRTPLYRVMYSMELKGRTLVGS